MRKLSAKEFDRAVQRAILRIPPQIRTYLDNMVISVQKRPSPELLEEMGLPPDEPLLGVYTGASLAVRSNFDTLSTPRDPDFQGPSRDVRNLEELEVEIEITVVHEVAISSG